VQCVEAYAILGAGPGSGEFKGGGGAPPIGSYFSKSPFFRVGRRGIYSISLCAFAINEDEADKLVSVPLSKFLDPPLGIGGVGYGSPPVGSRGKAPAWV